ncbi:mitochondrial import inner membrane translocase subunit TIM16 [Tilletia horrida]|nr:mitochondrial import inner membrane translocase subunit TIM16 [Tilletia horrida]
MSNLPRIIGQIIFNGSIILGRAFAEAGKQAIRNARSGEASAAAAAAASHQGGRGGGADGTGAGAAGGDPSHALTRLHRMSLQEALLILNLKPPTDAASSSSSSARILGAFPRTESTQAELLKRYEHLFKTNAPPAPKGADPAAAAKGGQGSFYVQSKIVRARERIEAEWEAYAPKPKEGEGQQAAQGSSEASGSGSGSGSGSQSQSPPSS